MDRRAVVGGYEFFVCPASCLAAVVESMEVDELESRFIDFDHHFDSRAVAVLGIPVIRANERLSLISMLATVISTVTSTDERPRYCVDVCD